MPEQQLEDSVSAGLSRRLQILVSAAGVAALVALGAFLIHRLQPAPATPSTMQRSEADVPLGRAVASPAQLPAPP